MLNIIFFYLLIVFISIFTGILIIKLFKLDNEDYIYLFSPIIGISAVIILSQNLGLLLPGRIVSIIIGLLILCATYFLRHDLKVLFNKALIIDFISKHKILFFFCGASSIISLIPLFYMGYLTTFNAYNSDVIVYLSNPILLNKQGYLFHYTFGDDLPLYQYSGNLMHNLHERIGFDYFTMNLMNITGLDSYQLVYIEACFIYSLLPLVIYLFLTQVFNANKIKLFVALTFCSVSPIMLRVLFSQFYPQMLGIVISIAFCTLLYKLLFINNNTRNDSFTFVIILAGVVSVYPDNAVYLVVYTFILMLLLCVFNRENFLRALGNILKLVAWALVINVSASVLMFYKQLGLFKATQGSVGNIQFFVSIGDYLLHMLGISPDIMYKANNVFEISVIILFFAIVVLGFSKSEVKRKSVVIGLVSISFLLFIYFRYISGFPYGVYKHIVSVEWIFIILIAIGIEFYLSHKSTFIRYSAITSLAVLIVFSLFSVSHNYRDVLTEELKIDQSFIELSEIKNMVPKNEAILLKTDPYIESHNALYFLRDRKVSLSNSSYLGDFQNDPSNGYSPYILSSSLVKDIYQSKDQKILWQNERFGLVYLPEGIRVDFGEGFYGAEESGGYSWRWLNGIAVFNVNIASDKVVKLSFDVNTIAPTSKTETKNCELYLNDKLIGTFVAHKNNNSTAEFDNVQLEANKENSFKVVVLEGADEVPNDTRKLSISLSNFEIK